MKTPKQIVSTAITDWTEKAEKNGHAIVTQVKLVHVPEGRPEKKLNSFMIAYPGTNLNDTIQQILDLATEDANNSKGVTVEEYHIIPYFGTELEEGGYRKFLIRITPISTGDGSGLTEGPNDVGQKAQGMRHLEKRFEQVDAKDMFLTGALQEELKRAYKRIGELETSLSAANQGLEEAKDKSLERKLAIYKANSEEQRKDRALDAIIPVAGMLANAAMGAPVFSVNSDDANMKNMIAFLSSFNTKQIEHMYQCMDPQQKIIFDATLEEIKRAKMEEMREKQKKADAAVNGVEHDPKTVENLAKRQPQAPDGGPT